MGCVDHAWVSHSLEGHLVFQYVWLHQWLCCLPQDHKGAIAPLYSHVCRDCTGWPASLPYIRKIRVSVAMCTHPRKDDLHVWQNIGSSKNDKNLTAGKLLKLKVHFHNNYSSPSHCCRCSVYSFNSRTCTW